MVEANDDSGAPWDDTLREQDWESLGPVFDDRLDHGHGALEWDTHRDVSDTHDVSSSVSGDSEITSAPPSHNMQIDLNACAQQASKVCLQFTNPVCSGEIGGECIEESAWPFATCTGPTQPITTPSKSPVPPDAMAKQGAGGEKRSRGAVGSDNVHMHDPHLHGAHMMQHMPPQRLDETHDETACTQEVLMHSSFSEPATGASKKQRGGAARSEKGSAKRAGRSPKARAPPLKISIRGDVGVKAEAGVYDSEQLSEHDSRALLACHESHLMHGTHDTDALEALSHYDTAAMEAAAMEAAGPAPVGGGERRLFAVHLLVTAIADGAIMTDTGSTPKVLALLDQVRRKVSKEQNTVVQLGGKEGAVDLKMRVFVANSVEARAVWDYISAHANQVPAPFVVLAKQLHMAVWYHSNYLTNPCHASVADRLRKQIKTHAVKVLREAMAHKSCAITRSCLRGYQGCMQPSKLIQPLLDVRTVPMGGEGAKRYILLPAKNKAAAEEVKGSSKKTPRTWPCASPSLPASPAAAATAATGAARAKTGAERSTPAASSSTKNAKSSGTAYLRLQVPETPRTPDTSAPSTPGGGLGEEGDGMWEPGLTANFSVNLFVTAIAAGEVAADTAPKLQERLCHIVTKVPKEQKTCVEVGSGGTMDLKMRVFVVNSEDAKAVGEYINAHLHQVPAPFVVLAKHLSMAVLYDPNTLDLTDASVADRLRKQAKTRAVKVLRQAIAHKGLAITHDMLRGHSGAMHPAHVLQDVLASRTEPLPHDPSKRCVVFAARNKTSSLPSSPRKRNAPESPRGHAPGGRAHASPRDLGSLDHRSLDDAKAQHAGGAGAGGAGAGGAASRSQSPLSPSPSAAASQAAALGSKKAGSRAGGGARKGGGSSASHLHRNMLDKAMNKKIKGIQRATSPPATSPHSSPTSPHSSPSILQPSLNQHAMMHPHSHMPHLHAPAPHSYHAPHGAPASVMGPMSMGGMGVYHPALAEYHGMPPTSVYAPMPVSPSSVSRSPRPQPHSH